jgi:glutathione reductase (NADPH)
MQVNRPDGSEQVLKAKNILVATGGAPSKLNIEGAEHCITSDEALSLDNLPDKSVLIVGSG